MERRWSVPGPVPDTPRAGNAQTVSQNSFRMDEADQVVNGLPIENHAPKVVIRTAPYLLDNNDTRPGANGGIEGPFSPIDGMAIKHEGKFPSHLPPKEKFQYVARHIRKKTRMSLIVPKLRNPDISPESLCERCSSLHLRLEDFLVDQSHTWTNWSKKPLGPLRDILTKRKQCKLCRLVIWAFEEQLGPLQNSTQAEATIDDQGLACSICWETDGTELVSDDYGNQVSVPRTRCLRLIWSDSKCKDSYLVLAYANTVLAPERSFLGRMQTSLDKPIREKVKEWYEICQNNHDRCNAYIAERDAEKQFESLRSEPYFGVVDLEDMRLTSLPQGEKYAALSYVWGDPQLRADRFKALLEHIDKLRDKQGLEYFSERLSRTIRDAIDVVRSVGLRYLWVDALCIIQDDEDFWNLNATKMHLIYGNAAITICAADGNSANSGTKAFHPLDSRFQWHFPQHIEYIKKDLNLMVWNPFEMYLERSTWSKRAWTFQEYRLSHRKLIFVEGRAYFQCPSTTMSLDKYSEDTTPGKPPEPLEAYRSSVAEYTPRELSHEEDIMVAFSGIGTTLCKSLGGVQVFCLPNSHFDWALLWQPTSAATRREPILGVPSKKFVFPSWSWCAWSSAKLAYPSSFTAGCEINIHEWLRDHTWIAWFIRDTQGNLNLVWDPVKSVLPSEDGQITGYRAGGETWLQTHGFTDTESNKDRWVDNQKVDIYGRVLSHRVKDLNRYTFYKTMPKWPYNVKCNPLGYISPRPYQRFLQFWTWSAHFSVKPEDPGRPLGGTYEDPGKGLGRFCIFDGNREFAGVIILHEDFVKKRGPLHEFIALSEGRPFTRHEADIWNHYATSTKENTEWYLYHVMLLQYEDPKELVARRVGVGKMYKRAFEYTVSKGRGAPGRKHWKEIILG